MEDQGKSSVPIAMVREIYDFARYPVMGQMPNFGGNPIAAIGFPFLFPIIEFGR